ncbi:MBL fold metallo-hydrolase [soil metagenome]
MIIRFLGADRTVTGSSHLIEVNGLRILLDCGIYQGPRDEARRLNTLVPSEPGSIDAVILSHGHLDHSGKLPVLLLAGYRGPIYCTSATSDVARIILEDSAKIQEEDAAYLNRRAIDPNQAPISPLYTAADVLPVIRAMKHVEWNRKIDLGRGVAFTLFDAGHILGSSYVWIEWTEQDEAAKKKRTLLFTADIGRYNTPINEDPVAPPGAADLLITESTYGGRSHGPIDQVEPQFEDAVKACVQRQSRLLVPSFAVGRTQTVLYYIAKLVAEKKIPPIRTYIDSPMGVEVSHVYAKYGQQFDDESRELMGEKDLLKFSGVILSRTGDDSRKINNDRGPCVIIASSPTCEFGRILHHLKQSLENPKDIVLFVGFTPGGTLGRRIQDGQKRLRVFDRWYDLRCEVRTVHGLSAHADADELERFLAPALGESTQAFVVHGEPEQSEAFAARMVARGVRSAVIPAMTTSMSLYAISQQKTIATKPAASDGD